jgi:serine/threonine protein kinase
VSHPERIGRYRILGFLASGGMAEILLAKLLGPGGFERAVVVKRVLPHLARQSQFREMFLDEARIVARIQHPNVVNVSELGQEGRELFLVMEYLAGESLNGVLRRLSSRPRQLSSTLAAHVIAEAAAGLHSAHELKDDEGTPLGVVHRDVSPQNVFITYDGAVKLLDFGIAKFMDRSVETHTGQVKGKFAYMSPEQCCAERVDRRSDVFSLGILLWELLSGSRLFARPNEILVWKAIVEEPIPTPNERLADGRAPIPAALESVVMKALARDREQRHASANDLRRELIAAARGIGGEQDESAKLAELMRALFPDRIAQKEEMLRRVRVGDAITSVPTAEVDVDLAEQHESSEEMSARIDAIRAGMRPVSFPPTPFDTNPAASRVGSAPRSSRRHALVFGALVLAAVVIGAVLGVGWDRGAPTADARPIVVDALAAPGDRAIGSSPTSSLSTTAAPASSPPSTYVVPEVAAPAAAAGHTTAPSGRALESGALPSVAAAETAERSPEGREASATVVVRVDTTPPGARVSIAGQRRGLTPVVMEIPRGTTAVPIAIRLPGHREVIEEVVPDVDQRVRLTLERERRARSSRPSGNGTTERGFFRFD